MGTKPAAALHLPLVVETSPHDWGVYPLGLHAMQPDLVPTHHLSGADSLLLSYQCNKWFHRKACQANNPQWAVQANYTICCSCSHHTGDAHHHDPLLVMHLLDPALAGGNHIAPLAMCLDVLAKPGLVPHSPRTTKILDALLSQLYAVIFPEYQHGSNPELIAELTEATKRLPLGLPPSPEIASHACDQEALSVACLRPLAWRVICRLARAIELPGLKEPIMTRTWLMDVSSYTRTQLIEMVCLGLWGLEMVHTSNKRGGLTAGSQQHQATVRAQFLYNLVRYPQPFGPSIPGTEASSAFDPSMWELDRAPIPLAALWKINYSATIPSAHQQSRSEELWFASRLQAAAGDHAKTNTALKKWLLGTALRLPWNGASTVLFSPVPAADSPLEADYEVYPQLRYWKRKIHFKGLNRVYPPTSRVDSRHMTTRPSSMAWNYMNPLSWMAPASGAVQASAPKISVLNRALSRIPWGTNQVLATVLLIHGLDEEAATRDTDVLQALHNLGLLAQTPAVVLSTLAAVSKLARRCALTPEGLPIHDSLVGRWAYLDLAGGRSANTSMWEQEQANRCVSSLHIQSPATILGCSATQAIWRPEADQTNPYRQPTDTAFYDQLFSKCLTYAQYLVKPATTKEDLSSFWARRSEWVSSGSASGATINLKTGRSGAGAERKFRLTKRGWAENASEGELLSKLYVEQPREHAIASEKYENGKARAIYGVDQWHYVINTYATKGFEERLHLIPGLEKGISGLNAVSGETARANQTADPNKECVMLDYADFNRHHTPRAQAALFHAFAVVGTKVGAHADWVKANEWVANSKRRMSVKFPGAAQTLSVKQGMFSGTRSTDLINTLLNLAYFQIASEYIDKTYSITSGELHHIHQGDDVWITTTNPVWARLLYYTLNGMGFIFQKSKQMFGRQRGEYLRVMYSGGKGYGYLNRALVNYVLRPIQNDFQLNPAVWIETVSDGANTCRRRGLGLAASNLLWLDGMRGWAVAREHVRDKAPVRVPWSVICGPRWLGGAGAPPPGAVCSQAPELSNMPSWSQGDFSSYMAQLPTKMSSDWIKYISGKGLAQYSKLIRPDEIKLNLASNNFQAALESASHGASAIAGKKSWATALAALGPRKAVRPHPVLEVVDGSVGVPSMSTWRAAFHTVALAAQPIIDVVARSIGPTLDPISITTLADQSQRMISLMTNSRFKSANMASTALGVSRAEALQIIIHEAGQTSHAKSEAMTNLSIFAHPETVHWVDVLIFGVGSPLLAMSSVANPGLVRWLEQQYSSGLAIRAAYELWAPKTKKIARDFPEMQQAYQQLVHHNNLPTQVLY